MLQQNTHRKQGGYTKLPDPANGGIPTWQDSFGLIITEASFDGYVNVTSSEQDILLMLLRPVSLKVVKPTLVTRL